jgi:hypothetical protein
MRCRRRNNSNPEKRDFFFAKIKNGISSKNAT